MGIHERIALASRAAIKDRIERLIAMLDAIDGNPDLEPNGDELDYNAAEDDFGINPAWQMTSHGCPISDPGEEDDVPFWLVQNERRAAHAL